jgi:hypothetical protein
MRKLAVTGVPREGLGGTSRHAGRVRVRRTHVGARQGPHQGWFALLNRSERGRRTTE